MAIQRVLNVKLAIIGDGAATTYAFNTETAVSALFDSAPQLPGAPLGIALPTPIAVAGTSTVVTGVASPGSASSPAGQLPGQKINYYLTFASPTVTVNFASAPANGVVDYIEIGLIVP